MGEYIPTAKNGIVANLYDKLGFTLKDSNEKLNQVGARSRTEIDRSA